MIQHHKKLSLELLLPQEGLQPEVEGGPSAAAPAAAASTFQVSRTRPTTRRPRTTELATLQQTPEVLRSDALLVDGRPARITLSSGGLEWVCAPREGCLPGAALPATSQWLPFSEVLAARRLEPRTVGRLRCAPLRLHRLALLTFQRDTAQRCRWAPRQVVLESPDHDALKDWAAAVGSGLDSVAGPRPRRLLVVLNPNAGSRQARRLYRRMVQPVFEAGGIKVQLVETQRPGHACELAAQLTTSQLLALDGIVAVGGDGVFHEVLNGVLQARAALGPEAAEAVMQLRLAHIPAGSTDAVACTLHGTRSVFTAAMHVALGDRTALDVLRVDTPDEPVPKFASCIAAFGFMGDVMAASEPLRALGPLRYDVVGAAKLLANRAYPARVSYLAGHVARELHSHPPSVCSAACEVCRRAASLVQQRRQSQSQGQLMQRAASASAGGWEEGGSAGVAFSPSPPSLLGSPPSSPGHPPAYLEHASTAPERHGEEWAVVEGEFVSIMLIIMPCKSDKTRQGMARFGHLADGRMKLVLVHRCSPLQYLRFLLALSKHGVYPGVLPYVEVIDAVAAKVETPAGGAKSPWNLDGELVHSDQIAAEVHLGLLQVFSRGVED